MIPSLDIVIVNWNAGKQLRACLDSLLVTQSGGWRLERVVVVDNASTDNSLEGLDGVNLPLRLLRNPRNRGFAAACNQGAAGSRADYLLFLNPDTELYPDSLADPVAFMERPESARIGVCGIQLLDGAGRVSRSCARFPTTATLLAVALGLPQLTLGRVRGLHMSDWPHDASRVVDHVMGAFYLVRRRLFDDLEGFDERFFVYLEDLDLSLRVDRAGWQVFYLTGVRAFHRGGGTSEQVKATRLFYALSSRILYAFKHLGWISGTTIMLVTLLPEAVARIAAAIGGGNLPAAAETVRAYLKLWRALPALLFAEKPWQTN
jgi:GT2 family glycosyltransferase